MTPDEFAQKLDRFAKGLPEAMSEAAFEAAQQLNADITGRIFRVGGTKDIGGGTRGYRSESWVTEREDEGLQINRVDMTFTGDLKKSIKIFEKPKSVELKIVGGVNDINIKKARGADDIYEEENGSPVFYASDKEAKIAVEVFEETIADYIQEIF